MRFLGFTTYLYIFFIALSLFDFFMIKYGLFAEPWKEEVEKEEKERRILEEKKEKERRKREEEEKEEREERMKKEEEENKKRMEWERELEKKLANISAEEAIDFLEKEVAGGNLSSTQHSYLDRIVSKKKEEEKIREEKERIQKKEDFYVDNGLTVLPNGNIRDSDFEEYELEEKRVDFIVYKPEGMKGKRAYIKTDGENYLAWSGPIKIADKSNFLRGDFEKAKEESQPIEEAPTQEQESENVKVKQEKELESSDANLDITARLNKLTKLYDDGKLTKEEYQKKTNVLISKM